jgi:hypothetical protein
VSRAYLETSAEGAKQPLGYSRDGDIVTLRMSIDDFAGVLMALGISAGGMARDGLALSGWLALANRLNRGNPNYTPYGEAP